MRSMVPETASAMFTPVLSVVLTVALVLTAKKANKSVGTIMLAVQAGFLCSHLLLFAFFDDAVPPLPLAECEAPEEWNEEETAAERTGPSRSLALVLPFVDSQVETRVKATLQRWTQYPPCGAGHLYDDVKVTLYFYHPSVWTASMDKILSYWAGLGRRIQACFDGGVEFIYARLPDDIASRHPDGPCMQFFELFQVMQSKEDAFFVMEPDALPIQAGWLDALAKESQGACDRFWVRGSMPRCNRGYGNIFKRKDFHINGNAMFCAGDPHFAQFRNRVRDFYPPYMAAESAVGGCCTGQGGEGGHDHTFFQFLQHPTNYEYARTVLHRFQYTALIQNLCEDEYNASQVIENSPETFIVHSKAPFFTEKENKIRRLYIEILYHWADKNHVQMIARNESMTFALLEREICASDDYIYRVDRYPNERCTTICYNDADFRRANPQACAPAERRLELEAAIPLEKAYIWTTDFHVSPIACSKSLLESVGGIVHAEVDFNNCIYHPEMCKSRLKILEFDDWRGFSLDPCPNTIRRRFYEAYRADEEFRRVDFFICSHPVANCELFMPFNKTLVVYATTRLEFGRHDHHIDWRQPYIDERSPYRWQEWVQNLHRIASMPKNVIAANNMYDVQYIKYHTGLDAKYLPSWCGDTTIRYKPERNMPYLLGPYRDNLNEREAFTHPILVDFRDAMAKRSRVPHCENPVEDCFRKISQVYARYEWSDIAKHPALILIPYQVSTMFFFQLYRISVPIFAPSLKLLTHWVQEYGLMWERLYGTPERFFNPAMDANMPDPFSNSTVEYWLSFCDHYVFPHIQYYDSWDDLLDLLQTVDLRQMSEQMKDFNAQQLEDLRLDWMEIVQHSKKHRDPQPLAKDYDTAMSALWNDHVTLPPDRPSKWTPRCQQYQDDLFDE